MRMSDNAIVGITAATAVLVLLGLLTYNSYAVREAYMACLVNYSADTCAHLIQ